MISQTWVRLPSARKGDKCPISGFGRTKLQRLIYGLPSQGIAPKVKFRRTAGGRGGKGCVFVHVPSLMQHLLGEDELQPETVAALRALAASPDWCQRAIHDLLTLIQNRAGMTATEFLCWLLKTSLPSYDGLFPDRDRTDIPVSRDRYSVASEMLGRKIGAPGPDGPAQGAHGQTAQAAYPHFAGARP